MGEVHLVQFLMVIKLNMPMFLTSLPAVITFLSFFLTRNRNRFDQSMSWNVKRYNVFSVHIMTVAEICDYYALKDK